MSLVLKRTAAFSLCLLLLACGGGGGGSDTGSGLKSGGDNNSSGKGPSGAGFSARLTQAPAEGATLNGTVTLEIRGSGIENAELLLDSGYIPSLGSFAISADKAVGKLNLDTRSIPNGPIRLRISAFSAAAGSADASEIIAMPARQWTLLNDPAPVGTQPGRAAKCAQRGFPYTSMDDDLPVVCITALPLSPQLDYEQCTASGYQFGTGYNNPADGLPVLREGRLINKFYCTPPAINGTVNPGCVCLQNG